MPTPCVFTKAASAASFQIMTGRPLDKYNDNLLALNNKSITLNSDPRGIIYDRNYNLLVDNEGVKTIYYKKQNGIVDMFDLGW